MPDAADQTPLLSARSVVLSLLLGSHPDRLSASQLARAGEHFGVPAPTLRVAMTRAVSAGDLRRQGSAYALGDRLVARQERQKEAVEDAETTWDGTWEMAVVVVSGRPGPERAALRDRLSAARLAELREGVWARPANLRRPKEYAADSALTCFRVAPDADARALAADLWDLTSWARAGTTLLQRLHAATQPAARLAIAAHIVRHLTTDPMLPAELRPAGWPGQVLRAAYEDYQRELRDLAIT